VDRHRQHWGLSQWVAYLREKDIPIMPRSRERIVSLDPDEVAPKEMAEIVTGDPFLALRLLRRAERRRSTTLGHDTTTLLGAVQQVGVRGLSEAAAESPLCDDGDPGLGECEARATLSARIARHWAAHRSDVSPDEVALAALLGEIGELMLWAFARDIPERAQAMVRSGLAARNALAQSEVAGFTFKQLTLGLIEAWELPPLITQLVRGADTPRANIARVASDAARHLGADAENPALPDDLITAKRFLPGVPWHELLAPLPISTDYRIRVLQQVLERPAGDTAGG